MLGKKYSQIFLHRHMDILGSNVLKKGVLIKKIFKIKFINMIAFVASYTLFFNKDVYLNKEIPLVSLRIFGCPQTQIFSGTSRQQHVLCTSHAFLQVLAWALATCRRVIDSFPEANMIISINNM